LLISPDRPVLAHVDPIAREERPLLTRQPGDPGAQLRPHVGQRRSRRDLHLDRGGLRRLAIPGEEENQNGHGVFSVPCAAAARSVRRSRTTRRTSATMASIPARTSTRRVNAVNPGVCTIVLWRSILRTWGPAGAAGISRSSPRTVLTGISPRLTHPIGFPSSRI